MMYKAVILSAVLAVTACSKKKEGAPATADKPTTGTPAAPGAAPAAPAAPVGKLDCDKILSKDLRDKYFPKMAFKDEPAPMPEIGKCAIEPGDSGNPENMGSVQAICNDAQKINRDPIIKAMMDADKEYKPIDGVPQSLVKTVSIGTQLSAYDQDSNCKIDATLPKGVDPAAFAKDWLAALPPK